MRYLSFLSLIALAALVGCGGKEQCLMTGSNESKTAIFQKGEKGSGEMFTGTTWVRMLVTDKDKAYDTQAYNVVFEPGARTFWHSHPGGQILFVTSGKGFYQEKGKTARPLVKGDVVEIPPNLVHWHGASKDQEFVHLGVSARNDKGPANWHGAVTAEEYGEAINGK